jgi:queuine tRNA-ribosyltransferase
MAPGFSFHVRETDPRSAARRSVLTTPHGPVDLPAFMPVGTQGSVKGLEIDPIRATGTQMVLANTYHLALRPGAEVVRALGGLHVFMGWDGPILTDSGGFQLFSLAQRTKITDEEAVFQSHIDGRAFALSPEGAIAIQAALGCDIAMVLDHVVPLPNSPEAIRDAMDRTIRWAARCRATPQAEGQAMFAIVQGGLDPALRHRCAEELVKLQFDGYAIGGLSVGESPEEMYRTLDATAAVLPADRPRYLMGVGRPVDLVEAIRRGVDLFDCVIPTRNGRNAMAFTDRGGVKIRNLKYECDPSPIEPGCPCPACRRSRGYLRHLFMAGEMLGPILLSLHNITYYQRLLAAARAAIAAGRFETFFQEKTTAWTAADNVGDPRENTEPIEQEATETTEDS